MRQLNSLNEGTTAAGKTTVGAFKFILCVAESDSDKPSVISGLDIGTVEKNILNCDMGLLEIFGDLLIYNGSGTSTNKLPHLILRTSKGDKTIYIAGYNDKARWKKILGSQMFGVYIDEINIADMEFIREASMRCDYLIATLNPDDPSLPVYGEYINHSRPLPQYKDDAPEELNQMLDKEPKEGWVHWYFSFEHNAGLSPEKKNQIISSVPIGTKLYKNKIQGLRGRSTGLIFDLRDENIITRAKAKTFKFTRFSCGVDTSYSRSSDDTIVFSFGGLTIDRKWVILAEQAYNNKDREKPLSPSDIPPLLIEFLENCRKEWGFGRDVFIDSADAGTIIECEKYRRSHGCVYMFTKAWKKTQIIDRLNLQRGWMAHGDFLILDECKEHIRELNLYSWQEDKDAPEDRNDHSINASQYAWLPFKGNIGSIEVTT